LNGALPSTAVSWIVTHSVLKVLPYVCRATGSGEERGACDAKVIGWFD